MRIELNPMGWFAQVWVQELKDVEDACASIEGRDGTGVKFEERARKM